MISLIWFKYIYNISKCFLGLHRTHSTWRRGRHGRSSLLRGRDRGGGRAVCDGRLPPRRGRHDGQRGTARAGPAHRPEALLSR